MDYHQTSLFSLIDLILFNVEKYHLMHEFCQVVIFIGR